MNLLGFFENENVKEVRITKKNITNDTYNGGVRKMDIQISVEIISITDNENVGEKEKSVKEYTEYWFYNFHANTIKPSSYDRKETTIKKIIAYLGSKSMSQVTSDDIQDMINDLVKSGLSYSTVKKVIEVTRQVFAFALEKQDIIKNPALAVSVPKNIEKSKNDIKSFTDDELQKIETEAVRRYQNGNSVYRLGQLIIFLSNTGLRISEALALKWTDIDFMTKRLYVNKNIVVVKNRNKTYEDDAAYKLIEQKSTKTKSGERIIPITTTVMTTLDKMQELNVDFEYVFANANGKPSSPHTIDQTFRKILKNAGVKSTGVHALRHTFASRLFRRGVDVKIVSELLGHSDVGITYDTYIHIIKEQHITAMEELENNQ